MARSGQDPDHEIEHDDDLENEDLPVALRALAHSMLRSGSRLALLLGAPSDAGGREAELELVLEFPVTRADTVARGIAAFDARWRLVLGLLMRELDPAAAPVALHVADLLAPPEYALVIVDADMGSMRLRLAPSTKTQAALVTTAAVIGIPAGLAQVTGIDGGDVIDAIRGDGDRCEQVGAPPLSRTQLDQLENEIQHMPTGIVLHGKVRLDNGALVNFTLPQPPSTPRPGPGQGRRR